jgi:hypothetical protein
VKHLSGALLKGSFIVQATGVSVAKHFTGVIITVSKQLKFISTLVYYFWARLGACQ